MYVDRTLAAVVDRASTQFPVVLVTGARQVGKTTLLRHLAEAARSYATLDDPLVAELARADPALFLQRYPPPVLIDEVQYAPGLLRYVKLSVDRERRPGAFWITGSQHFQLMKGVSESLAGRAAVLSLGGLTRRESAGRGARVPAFVPSGAVLDDRLATGRRADLKALYGVIWRGTLPGIALHEEIDRDLFYGGYLQTYLQRDVRDLARVGDESAYLRFLRAAAARTGTLLNVVDLARDADVAANTAKGWLSILETTGLVFLLQPFHTNRTKRLVKAPKLYFMDTGLAAYLTAWSSPDALEAGAQSGAMFETWVVSEIVRSYWHDGRTPPVYFYRDRDRQEIDLLIERDGALHPIEIKKSASPSRQDTKRFGAVERLGMDRGPGGLVCLVEEPLPLTEHDVAIPAWAL